MSFLFEDEEGQKQGNANKTVSKSVTTYGEQFLCCKWNDGIKLNQILWNTAVYGTRDITSLQMKEGHLDNFISKDDHFRPCILNTI